jgi:release factor glutamine methyltransferase
LILREALLSARERLRASGSDEAEIEAGILVRHALGLERATFLRVLFEPISPPEAEAIDRVLRRRFEGEPVAYITGGREFYGLEFSVTPAVLIPRPETEMLVEAATAVGQSGNRARPDGDREAPAVRGDALKGRTDAPVIVDVGTGSGAIAVSLARALPDALVYAMDVSADAILVARENARNHGVERRIVFRRGDLLEPLDTEVDLIAANLPYVTERDWQQLPASIREHEPRLALASGDDGLEAIRALLNQAPRYLRPGGAMLLEFGIGQASAIEMLARTAFPGAAVDVRSDFAGIPRLLVVRLPRA